MGRILAATLAFATVLAVAHAAPLTAYDRAEVATARTSIYLGSVTLTNTGFTRTNGTYHTSYAAKVFPFFFSNERGQLGIDVSDEMLRRLERGEAIDFSGRAVSEDGDERHVEGKATPDDAKSGKLKVRVFVSKRIQLIFNTTYRFPDVP